MPFFSYRALNEGGGTVKGVLNASTEREALSILRERSVHPFQIRPARNLTASILNWIRVGRGQGISSKELAVFTRQFCTLIQATVPYDTALRMVQVETSNPGMQSTLDDIRSRVVEGAFLADAISAHPKVFPPIMANMIRSGEKSGTLSLILDRLAIYFETSNKLRTRIAAAMVYPIFMMLFSLAVVIFMFVKIIPNIIGIYKNYGGTLPLPTRILIAVSDVVVGYWWLLLPLTIAAVVGAVMFARSERGRRLRDRLELRVPVWRTFRRKVMLQRFTETLATMLKSGVELDYAILVSSEVMVNRIYLNALKNVTLEIQNKGMQLSVALRRTNLFPDELCQMIAIGEETANLDTMLENVSMRLSLEVSAAMDSALALLEPVMILVMGTLVGFIVISVLLPILNQNQLLG